MSGRQAGLCRVVGLAPHLVAEVPLAIQVHRGIWGGAPLPIHQELVGVRAWLQMQQGLTGCRMSSGRHKVRCCVLASKGVLLASRQWTPVCCR